MKPTLQLAETWLELQTQDGVVTYSCNGTLDLPAIGSGFDAIVCPFLSPFKTQMEHFLTSPSQRLEKNGTKHNIIH